MGMGVLGGSVGTIITTPGAGVWTKPPGVTVVRVIGVGAGGGGQGGPKEDGNTGDNSVGGGGGGAFDVQMRAADLPAQVNYSVGAGGAGGAGATNANTQGAFAGNGGSTWFGPSQAASYGSAA